MGCTPPQVSTPKQLVSVVKSMLLPHEYPASVAPQFGPYMGWRASQYFFGCAISPRLILPRFLHHLARLLLL